MLELLNTGDGSHTIRHVALNETYHSVHGAIQESRHVYIQEGLHYYLNKFRPSSIRLLEIGFGTGLNALLSWIDEKARNVRMTYHTVEAFPLPVDILSQLNYPDQLGKRAALCFKDLHDSPWDKEVKLDDNFTIHKINMDIQSLKLEEGAYDIIYYDAFAPKIQPGLWEKSVLNNVIGGMALGGVLTTYCASGQFKRDLKDLNMSFDEVPGPPGKREMVRAYRSRK